MKLLGLILSVVALCQPMLLFAQDSLSLSRAIQIGLENNFDIRIARNEQKIAENNQDLGVYNLLPVVGVDGSLIKEIQRTNQRFADGREQNASNAQSTNLAASAYLNWIVFDGTEMFVRLQQLEEQEQAQTLNTEVVVENKIAEISSAFYTVILVKAQQKVFQESLALSQERMDIAEARYKVGKASKLEFLTAQVDYNADKSALIQQEEVLYNAKVELNNLLNRPPEADFSVPDQIDPNMMLSMEELKNTIISSNPNLLLAQRNQHIAYLETKRLRTQYFPTISLNGGYNYNSLEAQAGFVLLRKSNGPYYGVTGSWTIFDGFNRKREVQNARITAESFALQTENIKQSLLAELEKNFMDYKNSMALLELEQENLDVAKQNTQIALERYRLGNTSNLELREVQQNAVEAESRLINAVYSTKIAEIELLRLSGKIIENNNI